MLIHKENDVIASVSPSRGEIIQEKEEIWTLQ